MNQTSVDKTQSIEKRIEFLRYCAKMYEYDGTSSISDKEYDEEYYQLEQLDPDNSFFSEVGGEIDEHIYGTSVKHDIIMGSLSKCPDIESFSEWLKNTFKGKIPSLVLQHKIDGLSLSLLYKNGELVRALTRGDGEQGIDVTLNAKYVGGVPNRIDCKEEVEVRGECYKRRDDFYKNWHKSVGGKYANPRNFSSGSLNQKDPEETQKRGLSFIGYEALRKQFNTEAGKNKWIKSIGFSHLWEPGTSMKIKEGLTVEQVTKAVKSYMDSIDRSELQYDIDGIVVKIDDIALAKSMGTTAGGKKPKSSRAVKFPPEEKETVLEGVTSNVGRTGVIVPVAHLKPVELGGAMISKATLHNWGALVGKDAIKIGAKVVIAKKGDIIPQIVSVKENGDQLTDPPTKCPCCGEDLEWDDDNKKVNLVCLNTLCIGQLNKRIEHWFKKIGTKGIGPGVIKRLTNVDELEWDGKPIVSSLAEMYYMLDNDRVTEHPFRKYNYLKENLGEKNYQNILDSIHSVKEVTLSQLIQALGIGSIGRMSTELVAIAPTIEDIDKLTVSDIVKIDKFADKKANSFVNGWKKARKETNTLMKYVKIKKDEIAGDSLKGKKFCFTGSFENPRDYYQKIVVANGGKVSSSVSKDTILVWDEAEMKSKYQKAISGGNDIITIREFLELIE